MINKAPKNKIFKVNAKPSFISIFKRIFKVKLSFNKLIF
jgi:hypothetical protein